MRTLPEKLKDTKLDPLARIADALEGIHFEMRYLNRTAKLGLNIPAFAHDDFVNWPKGQKTRDRADA